ncbi:cytochrome C [Thiorhodococcus mannitoliphagus]|uniref:Cytochrome C n=1 Tax=Thiorhodococcus mannitoliphagus TaxID=329406 RepID=A0A6P1DYK4_9GAMM|nr:cytochrome C [Thiorhodococcus mannitoliphagus]NEX22560.1 cytochrome C [Thiorhodococcus mannitoliphagus]
MRHRSPLLVVLTIGLLSLTALSVAFAGDGEGEERRGGGGTGHWMQSRAPVTTPGQATYAQECSACHMAYQAALLPALTWARIMSPAALGSHYGDDASLSAATINEITTYLTRNAADQRGDRRAQAMAAGTPNLAGPGETLPRITDTSYFKREHGEIPAHLVQDNPEVGSFSHCNACHRRATEGDYSERQIDIPGYGPWKD